MRPQLKASLTLLIISLFLLLAKPISAVTPMWGYINLVAGEGDNGLRDGEFHSALFNHPVALATDPEGTRLFVADRDNHSIRVIDLKDSNRVSTLCGTGKAGQADGDLKSASFNLPTLLVFAPENRLVVYDAGSGRLRLIDLQADKVTTLFSVLEGGSDSTQTIHSLAYVPKDHSLYFSQPGLGKLTCLNISSKETKTFHPDIHFPNPAALAVLGGKLCVADLKLQPVYQVDSLSKSPGGDLVPALTELGKVQAVLSLAASKDKLYALQRGHDPWVQVYPQNSPVKVMTRAGKFLENGSQELRDLFNFDLGAGLLPDPTQEGNFYFALPHFNAIVSLKDYGFDANKDSEKANEKGLMDFDYPLAKPPHIFRILELGDSRLFFETESSKGKDWPWGFNRMMTSPKRLEQFLNTWASLNDESTHYQVLHSGDKRAVPVHLRPYYVAPGLVDKFDVDLVLILVPLDFAVAFYQEHPYGKEGLPLLGLDTEFLLKPVQERLKKDQDSVLSDLYQRCLDLHFIKTGEVVGADLPGLATDERVRKDLVKLAAKPLGLLAGKLNAMKTKEGRPVKVGLVFFPNGNRGGDDILPTETYRTFWRDACREAGMPFYDLTEAVVSTRLAYFPTGEALGYHHYNDEGHNYLATLLANLLMKEKLIPLGNQDSPAKK